VARVVGARTYVLNDDAKGRHLASYGTNGLICGIQDAYGAQSSCLGSYTVAATCNFDVDVSDTNDYIPNATAGQPGYQTMKWTTVGNVSVTANNTTTIALP
jgi:hypothetical protein